MKRSRKRLIKRFRQLSLVFTYRSRSPFITFHIVDRYKRRLAAHRQSHVTGAESLIDGLAHRIDTGPLLRRIGLGHTRVFVDTRDGHAEIKFDFALFNGTGNRSG